MQQQNPMTPFIEERIASYYNMSIDPMRCEYKEIKVVDEERLMLKEKTIQEIAGGMYLEVMKQMAEKYPKKNEMEKIFAEFCEKQKKSKENEDEKAYTIVAKKIQTSLENCREVSQEASEVLIEIESEKNQVKIYGQQSSQEYDCMPTALLLLQYQHLFRKYSRIEMPMSIRRVEESQQISQKVFQSLKELSMNWKLQIRRNEIHVKLFEGINTKEIELEYNEQVKEMIPKIPKMVYGYLKMRVMELDEFKMERTQKSTSSIEKYSTAYSNTHFNLHILRNNYISQKVFEYFTTANQNDIIERSTTSMTILLGTSDPFVLQVTFIPIQYTFTVQKKEITYDHFDVYEKQSIEYILTTQQIIQQEIKQLEKEMNQRKEHHEIEMMKETDREKKRKEQQNQRGEVLNQTYQYMLMKRKRQEVNKTLHDIAMKYMEEKKQHLMIIQWNSRDQPRNYIEFKLIIYDKKEYENDNECESLKEFIGSISNGNEVEFERRKLTYLVFSEIGNVLLKMIKNQMMLI